MAETKCGMKRDYGQKEDRNSSKTEVKKNGGEEKSAGTQAAGQGGKRGHLGKQRMQIFPLHMKTLSKLSLHLSKNWLQVEQEGKKTKNNNTVLE